MRSRYYNPTITRFINQDVVQGSLDNAITLNRYAYANGNPVTYLDPFGTEAEEIPDQAKKALREQGIDPVAYSERNKRVAQITYTQEMYERDMKRYQKDKFWSDVALGAMSPFIAVNQFVVGSGEGICNLVVHPIQSTKAMWHGIWTSDPSKNIITAPMYGVVTQAGPLVRGELSAEELVDYQVNVFNTAMIAYGGAKTVDSVATKVSKLAKTPRLATIKGAGNSGNIEATYYEYKALRSQGYNASEAYDLIKQFRSGVNPNNEFVFHFTSLKGGKGIVESGYLKPTTLGLKGSGVYTGTISTPSWGVEHIPIYGWGVADTSVRIPIKISSNMDIRYQSWPVYTAVIRTGGEVLPLEY